MSKIENVPPVTNEETKAETNLENGFSDGIGMVGYLRGKVLLVTGATGFLAKVFIEKILRTVPDVGKIYLLIKAKDKDVAMGRLKKEIIYTELFKSVQQCHGKVYQEFMLSKLIPVVGNVCHSGLGMEVELAHHIVNEVDIIVNSAANTTFDERYDIALDVNTLGPCRLLGFAKTCRVLKLFLHVSTAYVNGQRRGIIHEKPFKMGESIAREKAAAESPTRSFPLLDVKGEIKLALAMKDTFKDHMVTHKMKQLGLERAKKFGWQDTYVFTKSMGEMMIDAEREDIPVVIVRPSVIESTYKEPTPGWIEGLRMLDPLILSHGKGELTGFPVDANGIIDVVPADMVVNAMLAAMPKHGKVKKPGLRIYHIASSVVNPLGCDEMIGLVFDYFNSFPYIDSEKGPIKIERMTIFNCMNDFDSYIHTETARLSTNSPEGVILPRETQRCLNMAKYLANIYKPYTFYGGRFDNTNMEKLMEELSEEEQRCFGFDVKSIDWKEYICDIHIPGLMRHVQQKRELCCISSL